MARSEESSFNKCQYGTRCYLEVIPLFMLVFAKSEAADIDWITFNCYDDVICVADWIIFIVNLCGIGGR